MPRQPKPKNVLRRVRGKLRRLRVSMTIGDDTRYQCTQVIEGLEPLQWILPQLKDVVDVNRYVFTSLDNHISDAIRAAGEVINTSGDLRNAAVKDDVVVCLETINSKLAEVFADVEKILAVMGSE